MILCLEKEFRKAGDILDLAAGIDLVKKSGAWYAYEGEKIGQGRENAKAYLESHPEVMEELRTESKSTLSFERRRGFWRNGRGSKAYS